MPSHSFSSKLSSLLIPLITSGQIAALAVTIQVNTSNVVMNDFGGVGTNAFLDDISSLTLAQKEIVKQRIQYAQFPVCRFWMQIPPW